MWDATLVTSHSDKQHAAPTFKRDYGFHPVCTFVDHGPDGTGEPLALMSSCLHLGPRLGLGLNAHSPELLRAGLLIFDGLPVGFEINQFSVTTLRTASRRRRRPHTCESPDMPGRFRAQIEPNLR